MSKRLFPFVAIAFIFLSGCMYMGKRVEMSYTLSKNIVKAERKTPLSIIPFIDQRSDAYSVGRAPSSIPLIAIPLRPQKDVAQWMTDALSQELTAAGYKILEGAEWKVGGVVHEAGCGRGNRIICTVRIEISIHMKDNWQVMKHEYRGEGSRPALLPEEDPYELSLQEALRDALANFRRDADLAAP